MTLKLPTRIAASVVLSIVVNLVQAQPVVLYSSNNAETVEVALSVVRKKAPSLEIQQVIGETGTLMKRIQAEAKNPRGDILWSGGFGMLGVFRDYMKPYRSPDLAAIPEAFRGPDDLWVGTNVHLMVMMVNEKQLKGLPMPTTWSDLMNPEWKGRFAITDPSKSATAYLLVYGLLKQFGREGLEKIAANAVVTSSSAATYTGTATGEYAVGLTLEYAAQEYIAGGRKEIRLVYPSEGSYLVPEGMFIVKGAKNTAAARTLYDVLLSREMQQELLVRTFRRPIRADIQVSKLTALPDLKSVKLFPLDQSAASKEYRQLIRLWNLAVGKKAK
jgi:iron(III) transport system substrate-binding protein